MRPTAWRLLAIASLLSAAAAATRPHYGGTLRVEMQARVAALDPAVFAAQENLTALAFDRLVIWSASAEPQPALAASWRHDAEFKRWEFQLRTGVRFHDGSPLTAATAAAALERLGALALGETLVIRSEQPAPKMLAFLAGAGQSIWKRGADGAFVGSGPFRVVNWDSGRRAVFAANDDYWGGRPYLDGIDIEMGRSLRDQALDFELNKADVVEMSGGDLRRASQSGRRVWTSAPVNLIKLDFKPAVEERVREAIALSIDRSSLPVLLQKQGTATVTAALLPQWLSGYAFLFPDSRDVERARQIVAGLPRAAQPLTIGYDQQDPITERIAQRIAVNAREVGIALRPVADSQSAASTVVRVRFSSPDAGEALGSAAGTLESLYAAERALLEGYRTIPLVHLPDTYGLGSRVRNWTATRWGVWKLENVWLAADQR